jgi:RNA polymerase sigma-70 factor, ECF subfamily
VTANEARQLLRRRRGAPVQITVELVGDRRSDPSTGVQRLDLRRALARLSPDDRLLLAMRYAVDLGSGELGAVLGTSPSAARMRLSRAVDRLRKELRDG